MKRTRIQEDKDCWFCFNNPKIERESIISLKNDENQFYLAMPKGPVTDEHFLIVPKEHIASTLELTAQQSHDYLA